MRVVTERNTIRRFIFLWIEDWSR